MDIKELKAMAYDTLANIEMLNNRMKQINEEIAKQMQAQKQVPVEEVKEEVVEEVKEEETK